MPQLPRSLLLFGAGKMGLAMLRGWLNGGLAGRAVTIVDPRPSDELRSVVRVHGCVLNPDGIPRAEVLVLAIKPQMLVDAAASLGTLADESTLVISVIAGKTISDLRFRLPAAKAIIRAMPNTPAAVGRSITGLAASPEVAPVQHDIAETLLGSIGETVWLADEALIDAVTAVSGSGPAYVFYMVECLAKAAEAAGLDSDVAMRLARATVEGAGELLHQDRLVPAATLRENVTSPNGTTAAALSILMSEHGLAPLMQRAVAAAKHRAGELSG